MSKQRTKEQKLEDKTKTKSVLGYNPAKLEKLMKGVGVWLSYYRYRPDVFTEQYLGLSLKPFQKTLLVMMMENNYSMILASRGSSKTYLTAIYCLCRCILFPGTKIVVASGKIKFAVLGSNI